MKYYKLNLDTGEERYISFDDVTASFEDDVNHFFEGEGVESYELVTQTEFERNDGTAYTMHYGYICECYERLSSVQATLVYAAINHAIQNDAKEFEGINARGVDLEKFRDKFIAFQSYQNEYLEFTDTEKSLCGRIIGAEARRLENKAETCVGKDSEEFLKNSLCVKEALNIINKAVPKEISERTRTKVWEDETRIYAKSPRGSTKDNDKEEHEPRERVKEKQREGKKRRRDDFER